MADNNKCMAEKDKAFLLDLIDLNELVGPEDLQARCQSHVGEGETCEVNSAEFARNLKELALAVAEIPICPKEEANAPEM